MAPDSPPVWWAAFVPFCVSSALGAGFAASFVGRLSARRLGFLVGACVALAELAATLHGSAVSP